jgi:hypothetical protein
MEVLVRWAYVIGFFLSVGGVVKVGAVVLMLAFGAAGIGCLCDLAALVRSVRKGRATDKGADCA